MLPRHMCAQHSCAGSQLESQPFGSSALSLPVNKRLHPPAHTPAKPWPQGSVSQQGTMWACRLDAQPGMCAADACVKTLCHVPCPSAGCRDTHENAGSFPISSPGPRTKAAFQLRTCSPATFTRTSSTTRGRWGPTWPVFTSPIEVLRVNGYFCQEE